MKYQQYLYNSYNILYQYIFNIIESQIKFEINFNEILYLFNEYQYYCQIAEVLAEVFAYGFRISMFRKVFLRN